MWRKVVAAMFGLPRDTELLDEFYCTHKGSLGKVPQPASPAPTIGALPP